MDGIVNILKPPGMSSHDVINFCRKAFGTKKIGHTGTLDPEAAGVLPVCVGKATKLADRIGGESKGYRAVLKLGIVTDSYDLEGNEVERNPVGHYDDEELRQALATFLGEQEQLPPVYSAIKVDGKKLYEYALSGQHVEIKPRKCTIFAIELVERIAEDEFSFDVLCSKGTYIRSICHDLGKLLGCGGAMKRLIRTSSGNFHINEAYTLEEVAELKGDALTKVEDYFAEKDRLWVLKGAVPFIENGNPVIFKNMEERSRETFLGLSEGGEALIFDGERLLGLGTKRKYDSEKGFAMILSYRNC